MITLGSAGVLAPGRWLWLRALAWMVALMVAMVVLYNAAARGSAIAMAPGVAEPAAWVKLTGAVVGVAAILLAYRLAVGWAERRAVPELGLRGAGREATLGAAIGAGLIAAIVGIQWAAGWVTVAPRVQIAEQRAARGKRLHTDVPIRHALRY